MPAEIFWENMGLSKYERHFNQFKGLFLTSAIFSVFIGIACIAVFFISCE
jgi:hypothetical protein